MFTLEPNATVRKWVCINLGKIAVVIQFDALARHMLNNMDSIILVCSDNTGLSLSSGAIVKSVLMYGIRLISFFLYYDRYKPVQKPNCTVSMTIGQFHLKVIRPRYFDEFP